MLMMILQKDGVIKTLDKTLLKAFSHKEPSANKKRILILFQTGRNNENLILDLTQESSHGSEGLAQHQIGRKHWPLVHL